MPQIIESGIIKRDAYADLLDKSMDVVWQRKDRFAGKLSQFFKKVKAKNGAVYKFSSVGQTVALPSENEDTENMPYVQPGDGYDKTLTYIPYRIAIRITDNMRKMDRFSKCAGMMQGLVKSAMRKQEYLRADIFNNAFTGTAGADGVSLCNNSHPNPSIGTGTWDNLGTGALTQANLQALRLLAAQMVNDRGQPDPVMIKKLLVPPALLQKATELTSATLMPENALNQPNVLIRNLQIVDSPYLSSSTAYFVEGDLEGDEKGLMEVVLTEINKKNNNPQNADILMDQRVKFVAAYGFGFSKNIFGSAG